MRVFTNTGGQAGIPFPLLPRAEQVFHHRFTRLPLYDLDNAQLKYMADAVIDTVEEITR